MRVHHPAARIATAVGLSLGVTGVIYFTMQGNNTQAAKAAVVPKTAVLVVKNHVPAYAKLTPADVVLKQLPAEAIPAGALKEPDQAIARFAKQELFPDEPLIENKLVASGSEFPTSLPLPKGKRAVTVAVNEVVGVAGFIGVGSMVDVIATIDVESKSVSRIILQNIQVLAAAQNPQKDDNPQAKIVSSVTLAVAPEQAEELTLATEKGSIRLAMRSPLEAGEVRTDGTTPGALIGLKPAAPAKAPAAPKVKTVYKVSQAPAPKVAREVRPADPGIMLIRGTNTSFVQR